MTTLIVLTEDQAIKAAKLDCICQFEKSEDLSVDDDMFMNAGIWLQTPTSCQCSCGQTKAINMVMFASKITDSMIENGTKEGAAKWRSEVDDNDAQYYSLVGICESCGEDY